ncbi:hypothetical protein CBR_g12613 [Chara braunii]|uniref:Uncharacterized protein n=1 Tax=Chara braunii TaxID=69332 RepID=A0A388KSI0_CHABU|nr:hypothetical protein CBR_g12613 [Chara braunii]|eukprot:GBG72893.1 hypothetical protein CBR_g12613 [Chara braunii]
MLLPIEFLRKTNGYRKSGQFPTVTAGYQLTLPLVPFDAPVESLAGLSMCFSDRRQVVLTPQQPLSGKEKVITYQRRSSGRSSGNLPKKKGLARPPSDFPGSSRARASSRSRDTAQRGMDEESDEDEWVRQLHSRLLATPGYIRGEGSFDVNVGREAGGGVNGEYDEDEGECGSGERREQVGGAVDHMEWEKVAASGGVGGGSVGGSEMEDEELEDEGGDACILRIPVGDITFNQRSLNMAIVAGIDAAIEASTRPRSEDDPAPWDPLELVLAPITPSQDANSQGIRVLPQDFDPDRADEFFYYPVAGQHTSEVMKRVVTRNSAAVEVFGFRNYDRIRIIYFDDDHTNGYTYVSTYDNTRADRFMLSSFHQACEDIRGFWDSKKRIGLVGNVSKGDPTGVTHQEEWRNFMRLCMGKSCDKSLWTECLAPKWDLTNRMRGYMNVATCKDWIWTLAIQFLGKDVRNDCTVQKQKTAHRPNRDMYHKLGKKRNKMWEYLFQDQPKSSFEHDYIVRKAMAQEAYGGYHKAQVGAFAMFVARCEQMKFTANQAMLTYGEYNNIVKTTDAWNPIESDEETKTSDLKIEERVKRLREGMQSVSACSVPNENPEEGRTKSGGASSPTRDVTDRASSIEQMQTDSPTPLQALENTLIHGNRHGFQGRSRTLRGNTKHNMLADADNDDLAVPDALPRLMLGDDIPDRIVQVSERPYFIEDKVPETTPEKWRHHILWHTNVFEPCIFKREWMMALHLTSGWKVKPRLTEVPWLKVTKSEIVFRVRCENEGADEVTVEEKAQLLFDSLHSNN